MNDRKPRYAAPKPRQHLGTFEVSYCGELRQIAIFVNAADLAICLAGRAVRSPSRRAKMIFGSVLAEDVTP
jgi:hypothetical protein